MKLTDSLVSQVSSIGFGCAGLGLSALGVGGPLALGIAAGMGLATAAGHIVSKFSKHGIDSESALRRIRNGVEDRFRNDPAFRFYEDQQAITRACDLLEEELGRLQLNPKELAETASDSRGFPVAATEIVLERLIETSKTNPESTFDPEDEAQIAFTIAVLTTTFETAVLDDQYWNEFNKHLQLEQSKGIGELKDGQAEILAILKGFDNQGLSEDRVFELARSVREDIDDIDDARRELSYLVGVARDYLLSGGRGDNLDEFVSGVLNAAKSKPRFADGADEIDNGLKQVKRDKQDAADRLAQLDQSEVTLLEEGIKLDVLALRPNAVADKEIRLIELTEPADAQFNSIRAKRREYYERGRDKGIRIDLEIAIALARLCLTRATDPDEAGMAGIDLGNAFQTLGSRESNTRRLEQAVTAYQNALKERTRDRAPLQWAMTQNNLGLVLSTLGTRESGTARLEEAVTAYQNALKEYTRDRAPLYWAATQMNLGNALATLGRRENGTERLEQAVTAYQNALKEYTRDRVPLDWATTQMNLGNALATLGSRESNTRRLEQAVTAYQNALEEYTRDRVPLDWAMTQMNLGSALQTLGERESGTQRLEQAVTAFQNALEEYTRDRVPLDWATTQMNLGNALQTLGQRESGTQRLEQAVTAYQNALEERTRDRVPLDWATTQNNLGAALQTLGSRESGTQRLEQAVTAYQNALEERTRERVPLDWAITQNNLGNALATLGSRESNTRRLEEAVTAYQNALEERTRDRLPLHWAMTQGNLANLYETMGDKGEDHRGNYLRSIACADAALEVFEAAGASQYVAIATQNRNRVKAKLAALDE